ncbi:MULTISPECIES: preprotein translocase subunit YajC [Ruminococcus]|uniref:Preprotein translocase subunit YajC n=1 Tax=Ruminococcus flavefaciens TaxID=1265 RepID=A0A315Y0A1_RUMFL|nr:MULTISPECIES: preprotein translocase subunit YajC [Ruminococcus]MBQ6169757.1 preprotein translocase subunit YajC [Ruminococcus sp.]MBR1429676.1 preprotein translocase subunit YajC [Ruminococcus sp.]PWJ13576.1 preprotein translocase subunit YajC [Ruminococcus flavefaciens]SSA48103.1 preprotein translocase subunit YajC [Ruminococcus flavefaciens]
MNKKIITSLAAAVCTMAMAGSTALNAFAEGESSAANGQQPGGMSLLSMPLMLIIMFVLLYFMAIRPQKKRDRELKEMQESLQIGDEIVTGGGIVGIVVSVGEDTVVIETGGAKHKLRIKNWAITENVTAAERIKEAKASGKKSSAVAAAAVVDDDDDADKKSKKKNKKKDDEEE